MTFLQNHERLRTECLRRIQRGDLTNGLLSRQTGLSKSHVSKFLRGRGHLSFPAADSILRALRTITEDLTDFSPRLPARADRHTHVPVFTRSSALFEPDPVLGGVQMWLPVMHDSLKALTPRTLPVRKSWRRFIGIAIDREAAESMGRPEYEGGIGVIDRHYNSFDPCHEPFPNVYAVINEKKVALRHVERIRSHLIIRPTNAAYPTKLIEIARHTDPTDYISGRLAIVIHET